MPKAPDFKNLEEEVEFWESHDSAEYWKDMEKVEFDVNLHQNLLHPKLIFLAEKPAHCPRCQSELEDKIIQYVTLQNGHLVVIRDVPALRCQVNGHEYMLEKILDQIEQLLKLEKTQKLQPSETMNVPVFKLEMAV